jgi:hypothetical protein
MIGFVKTAKLTGVKFATLRETTRNFVRPVLVKSAVFTVMQLNAVFVLTAANI